MTLPTKAMPPQAVLRDYFDYIPSSGEFTWKDRAYVRKNVRGQIAGSAAGSTGYRAVMFKKKIYQVHRLIWMWMTGDDPGDAIIDHINHDRDDNRWENLRLSDWSKNVENLKNGRPSLRKLAEPNICPNEGGFRVQLKRSGQRYRKQFRTLEEAVAWRDDVLTTLDKSFGPVSRDVRD